MKRLESNLLNMVLSLTLVTLAAAALLGGLYVLTEEPIQKQKADKQQKAITSVLPVVEGMEIAEAEEVNGMTIYKAYVGDSLVGAAVQTQENGFGGVFRLMVGFDSEGNVVNYEVLEHQETPGLGDHMTTWFKTDKNQQSVIGRSPAKSKFVVSKDGGDVDAITAATISSRAFLKAVQGAYDTYSKPAVEAVSGATSLSENAELQEIYPDNVEPQTEEKDE
ncbi:MAG: RnfABCDGE type electron transport complex subunit G [Paludibacteraceae bacterium]|nr:RnfABCDGE type electron transport complex subunit G [Paludibacteraceae bacterium]